MHKSHYKFHRNPKDGGVIVTKKYTDLDSKDETLRDDAEHREMKLKSKTNFVMTPEGSPTFFKFYLFFCIKKKNQLIF